ncbi:MAG: ATP-binding protein, partial [Clostridium sp.]|nr:ATP-binding protein [Clostridium sp.]
FTRAGEASSDVKRKLQQMGVDPEAIRKVAIAMYEGEINMVIHASGGLITVEITPQQIKMILADVGPGIPDVELAMQAGYSTAPDEIRSLGFGAGMGLPNMKKYSDNMEINTKLGEGTTITMTVKI